MAAAQRAMGATKVNPRGIESFAGIVTTITDATGALLRADEVFHQD